MVSMWDTVRWMVHCLGAAVRRVSVGAGIFESAGCIRSKQLIWKRREPNTFMIGHLSCLERLWAQHAVGRRMKKQRYRAADRVAMCSSKVHPRTLLGPSSKFGVPLSNAVKVKHKNHGPDQGFVCS